MPQNHTVREFLGTSKVMMRIAGSAAPLLYVGSVNAVDESVDVEKLVSKDHTTPGGGTLSTLTRINGLQISIDLQEFNAQNAKIAARGVLTSSAAGTVTDERLVFYPGGYHMLARIPSAITSITSADGEDTYIAGTDYILDGASVYLPSTSTIPSGENGKVTYAAVADDTIQGLLDTDRIYEVVLDGANEHQGNRSFGVTYHLVKFAPAAERNWITDTTRTLKIEGEVQKDTSKPAGKSPWYEERYQQAPAS